MSDNDIRKQGAIAFRDFNSPGFPGTGLHDPEKPEIRAAFGVIQDNVDRIDGVLLAVQDASFYAGTAKVVATVADLASLPTPEAGDQAWVRADPLGDVPNGNGVWSYSGSAWVWISPLLSEGFVETVHEMVEQTLDLIEESLTVAPLPDEKRWLGGFQDRADKFIPVMDSDGRAVQMRSSGDMEKIPLMSENDERYRGEAWPMAPLIDGQRPRKISLNAFDQIEEAFTMEAGFFVLGEAGLVELGSGSEYASLRYVAEVYSWGVRNPLYAYQGDVCLIAITLGQSNASGQNQSGDALIATTPIYDTAKMFSGGVRRVGTGRSSVLVDLIETADSNSRETSASGLANHLIRDLEDATGETVRTLSFNAGLGGRPYRGLKRGTVPYETFLDALEDAVSVCRANGWTPIAPLIDWMQGESDAGGPNYDDGGSSTRRAIDYIASMKQFDRDVCDDVRRITGQTDAPVIMMQQIARDAGDAWFPSVQQAQRDLHGVGNIRLVGPNYQHPFVSAGDDGIHMNCRGQNRRGQDVARASVAEVFGQGWNPVVDIGAQWASTTQIDITFSVPTLPLVVDATGTIVNTTGLTASKGFLFRDASTGTETAVTDAVVQADGVTVRLTLASAFTGREGQVGYARKRTSGVFDGPVSGARGLLRDSTADVSLYDSVAAANWCVAFIRNVGRP